MTEEARKAKNAYHKKWRQENREHFKKYRRAYYEKHKEHIKAYNSKWRRENKGSMNMMQLIETNRRPVKQCDMNDEFIKEWYSMSEAARSLNINVSNICNCCKGLVKSAGGYKWRKA